MKVLLATDGSDYSRLAESALNLAPRLRNAEVIVASVVPGMHVFVAGMQPYGLVVSGEQAREAAAATESSARGAVDAAVARLKSDGHSSRGFVLEGNAGDELLRVAEEEKVDLILVGSRGLGAVASFLLGSVARKLVTGARSSVLVVHPFPDTTPLESAKRLDGLSAAKAVVGVDGSDGSNKAMDWVAAEGKGAFAEVLAVCAEALSVVPVGVDPAAYAPLYQYDIERAKAVIEHAAERLQDSAPEVSKRTVCGRPADAISKTAAEGDFDLIVLGATRHGAIERFLIGSVSYEVAVKAPCSVLIVRP